jgi:PleD family two-component response regulator
VAVAPRDAMTVATLFKAADECLLAAKAEGKDRVVLPSAPQPAA